MKQRVLTHVVAEVSSAPETRMTCASSTADVQGPTSWAMATARHTISTCNHFTFAKDEKGQSIDVLIKRKRGVLVELYTGKARNIASSSPSLNTCKRLHASEPATSYA